ncbi:MAG: methyltransferase domain-containing protein [Acidobacteriales bacterium]|nr:methyltransferase domain-containing protein [Candidatus Koribacter versatilis]MBI3645274.1 methyltransferase domain-containing protein [Terriglobales bacterium]
MKRQPSLELLDTDAGTGREVAASLRDLQMFNQWFGGVRTTEKLVCRAMAETRGRTVSLLEVAAGAGYVPERIRERLSLELDLKITLLDRSRTHLNGNARAIAADALALPFADGSFDLVSCNLFVHHLGPAEVRQFAREALRISRVAFLINDLVRHPLHLALAYAGFPLYRSRLTRNDAPASVRQAYTPGELRDLLQPAGAARIQVSRHYLYRVGIIAWKRT